MPSLTLTLTPVSGDPGALLGSPAREAAWLARLGFGPGLRREARRLLTAAIRLETGGGPCRVRMLDGAAGGDLAVESTGAWRLYGVSHDLLTAVDWRPNETIPEDYHV